eukprot:GEMP01128124.1.p1 GENE.GEMP01128124.1~~GEMP01128124.1.p1  ORF type:complete len:108 (+),score=0.68 GEMP01128124.1:48-326(+)
MAYSRLCGPIYWFDRRIHFLGSPPKRGSPTPPSLAHSLIPSPTPSLFIELAVAENAPPEPGFRAKFFWRVNNLLKSQQICDPCVVHICSHSS